MESPYVRSTRSPTLKSPVLRGDSFRIDGQLVEDASEIVEIIHDAEAKKFRLGIMLIILAVATWMIGLELVNVVLKGDSYQKPVFFACITGSCFSLNLLPDLKWLFVKHEKRVAVHQFEKEPVALTKREVGVLSLQVAVIYLLYNICAYTSLKFTSASNQTVLSSTTSIFTLFIGSYLKIDSFSFKKVICIAVSFTGVILVNLGESKSKSDPQDTFIPKNPRLGNCLAIGAALMYACYLIIMKVKCGTGEKTTNERRLFGFVGIYTLIISVPLLYFADQYGYEKFEFPPPKLSILVSVLINGVFSFISDFATILASLLTSPLITSLSLTSSVPITIFCDTLILHFSGNSKPPKSTSSTLMYAIGIISILVSAFLINLNSSTENDLIEQVIEETIEQSIREDEILSPMLSPMLSTRPHSSSNFNSPLLPIRKVNKKVSNFSLEADGLVNRNHHSRLYTVEPDQEDHRSNILVYGGNNHIYHVKHVSNDEI